MKKNKLCYLLILIAGIYACTNSVKGNYINYFARAGLVTPKFGDEKLNEHLKSGEILFNKLGSAAAKKDLYQRDELNAAYLKWLSEAKQFGPKLSREEGQRLFDYLTTVNQSWNTYKSDLF